MTPIIVEDGTIVSGSNSYITVSGVDDYATDYGYSAWNNATDEEKTQAIFKSMRYLEALSWKGTKATQEQNLEFPQVDLYDKDGYLIPDDIVPKEVIKAQCEIAILCLPDSDINLQPNITKEDYSIETGITGATLERWSDIGAVRPISTAVQDILKGLINNVNTIPIERS